VEGASLRNNPTKRDLRAVVFLSRLLETNLSGGTR
jgi:hypothetical protein